jgi:hypothetical protein
MIRTPLLAEQYDRRRKKTVTSGTRKIVTWITNMQDLKRTTIIGGLAACLSDIRFSPKTDMTGETGMSTKGRYCCKKIFEPGAKNIFRDLVFTEILIHNSGCLDLIIACFASDGGGGDFCNSIGQKGHCYLIDYSSTTRLSRDVGRVRPSIRAVAP